MAPGIGDGGDNTVTQVRLDIAELKGIVTTSLSEQARRLSNAEIASTQLRVDLTAVNENLNARMGLQDVALTKNTENIVDIRSDISTIYGHINNQWAKVVGILTPIIALGGVALSVYFNTRH